MSTSVFVWASLVVMTDGIAAQAAWLLHTWDRAETSRQSAPTTVGWSARLPSDFSTWSLPLPRRPRVVRVVMLKTPYLSFLLTLPVVHSGDGGLQPWAPRSLIHAPEDALVSALDHPWTATERYDNSSPLGSGTLRHVEIRLAAPFMRQDHEHKQHPVWAVGTTKQSSETKSLTWLFRKIFHVGEGGFLGYHREPHDDQVTGTGKASQPRMLARGKNVKDWYSFEFSGRTGELVPCSMRRSAHGPWQQLYSCQGAGIPRCPPGRLRPLKLLSEKDYVWTSFRG
jgi:hypothetical protein